MSRHTVNVLLVEDDPAARRLIERILSRDEKMNYRLDMVEDLATAKLKLSEKKFDAIILDLNLPDSRGLKTIAMIRDLDTAIPVVVASAHDDHEIGLQCIKQGADYFLVKGDFMQHRLPRSIHYATRRRSQEPASADFVPSAQPPNQPENASSNRQSRHLQSQLKKVKQSMAVHHKGYKPLDYLS